MIGRTETVAAEMTMVEISVVIEMTFVLDDP
jgi:hypothetical protein